MRLVVTGRSGQVVSALRERGPIHGIQVVGVGRPEFDLMAASHGLDAIRSQRPDAIVSVAAYTNVDGAEADMQTAMTINAEAPAGLAGLATELGVPIIHLSTDYVFDGRKSEPYVETDPTSPLGVYGRTKLAGEQAVAAAAANHVILRTSWIYSPFGRNFIKTMLSLATQHASVRVVADQMGNPTSAFDIADAVIGVATNVLQRPQDPGLRGIFHMSGGGEASWAELATAVFSISAERGGPTAIVTGIATADYPTPATRPQNSRLSNARLQAVHGITLPDWRTSLPHAVSLTLGARSQR